MASFGSLRALAAASRVSAGNARPAPPPLSPRVRPLAQQHVLLPAPPAACPAATVTQAPSSSSSSTKRPAVPQNPGASSAAQRRSSGFDDSYDSAMPLASACLGWARVEEDLGLDEAPGADPQEWEEMVSLLSFDGEEHKHVTRQAHGANARVEDMFASFDGDDFEAVLRAVRSELPAQPDKADAAAGQQQQQHSAKAPAQSLYQSVCALREAAMAAEAARKLQAPALKKRRAPLGGPNPADAWMLQVPTTMAQGDASAVAQPAAAGTRQQPSTQVAPEQQRYSRQPSSQTSDAPLQLQQVAYIGLSCDSSSDASQDADTPLPATAAGGAAAAAGAPTAPGPTSNNIVSIGRLGVAAAAAGPKVCVPVGAAAAVTTAVLEAALVTAAAPVQLLSRAAVLLTATHDVQAVTGVQRNSVAVGSQDTAQAEGQQQRWGSRNTQGLRRALARLHHTQS